MAVNDPIDVSAAFAKFATSLFKVVSDSNGPSENVCVSPFSVAAILSMTHVGAEGNTAQQIRNTLHLKEHTVDQISRSVGKLCLDTKSDEKCMLKTANQLYLDTSYQLTEQFQLSLKNHFGASAERVDFASDQTRLDINKWVEEFTQEKIKNLIPHGFFIPYLTKLALVNAVYFKGDWQDAFHPRGTRMGPFYLNGADSKKDVNMMLNNREFSSGYIDALDARVLELPYRSRRLSMFIILPNKIDGLDAVESKLCDHELADVLHGTRRAEMDVVIPKFKIEANVDMKKVLMKMGMMDLFEASKADLSGISGRRDLFVDDIIHKAFIDVNEEGSEAAAATGTDIFFESYDLTIFRNYV